jgi:hypothetical protein
MPREDKRPKSRYWMLTGFVVEPAFDQFTMSVMRVGKEICPKTKKEHWHACIQFVSEIRSTTIMQIFPKQHFDMKKGNKTEFFAYSKKEDEFTDYGIADHGSQGDRNDFQELIEAVDEGETLSDLMRKFPKTVSRFMPYTKKLIEDRKDKIALEKRKSKYDKPLRQWQSELKLIIEGDVCDRSVY